MEPARASVIIPPVSEGSADFRVKIPGEASSGLTPVFVSLKSDGLDLHDWCEGMIRISK
jgi:hypothetical protein